VERKIHNAENYYVYSQLSKPLKFLEGKSGAGRGGRAMGQETQKMNMGSAIFSNAAEHLGVMNERSLFRRGWAIFFKHCRGYHSQEGKKIGLDARSRSKTPYRERDARRRKGKRGAIEVGRRARGANLFRSACRMN